MSVNALQRPHPMAYQNACYGETDMLTAAKFRRTSKPGMHSDGPERHGLFLVVKEGARGSARHSRNGTPSPASAPCSVSARLSSSRWPRAARWRSRMPGRSRAAGGWCTAASGAQGSRWRGWCQLKRIGVNATVHGFRGSFKTWAMESGVSRDVAEFSVAHRSHVSDVEATCVWTDLLEKRRPVMERWGRQVAVPAAPKVVAISGAAG